VSEVLVIPEGAHSVLGPSSAERWLNCGAGTGGGATEYAAEGTAAHTLSEWVREGKPLSSFKGKLLKVGDYEFKVGKNMMESVQTFVDHVNAEGPGVALTEERVGYEEIVPGGFGTTDHARLRDGQSIIRDFKHGKGVVVPAKENPQLMLYALGTWFKYGWMYEIDSFELAICQPRVRHFDSWEISVGRLLEWAYDVVRPRARLLLSGQIKGDAKAGPWCKFCGLKDSCSTRAAYKVQYERSPDRPEDAFVNLERS
jgi:hypothetical protein